MKSNKLALTALLAQSAGLCFIEAFTPSSFLRQHQVQHEGVVAGGLRIQDTLSFPSSASIRSEIALSMSSGSYLGMDEDEDDEEEDEDDYDDDDELVASRYSGAKSPFTGLKLDPWDPNPLIKPRPSRYFKDDIEVVPDEQLTQVMSEDERKENLAVMRQIRKSDLPDLRMRKDHAGWVEANNDLKRRFARDPWFGINERLRDAIQLGEPQDKVAYLQDLANKEEVRAHFIAMRRCLIQDLLSVTRKA